MLLLSTQYKLSKAYRTERQRLESVLSHQERRVRQAFDTFLETTRSQPTYREIRQLLESNNINGAMGIIDEHVVALGRVIPQAFTDAANQTVSNYASRLTGASDVSISFDASNPRAASLMRISQLNFVQQFSTAQRDATRVALANAYRDGAGTTEAARAFRDSIGLTRTQLEAVENYRRLLENGSSEALSRELRDRRYDRTVERAIGEGEPLEDTQIDRMVDRYRETMLTYRAENIARTEGLGVTNQARHEATQQAIEQADFDPDTVRRRWRATKDKRTRDSHAEMDGQSVGLDEPFVTPDGDELMFPGDPDAPAQERIFCRCTVVIEFD